MNSCAHGELAFNAEIESRFGEVVPGDERESQKQFIEDVILHVEEDQFSESSENTFSRGSQCTLK